ncbi:hypothetical protein ABVF54_14850 [Enterococcus mundtii]|uniref:hypothetical protein n=1 Tax=Enterococcus mundtii TaxID=53346 RepID=UPI00336A1A67
MSKPININVKRTGFPIGLANPQTDERIELWFDSSIESLKKFLDVDKLALEKYEKVKEYASKYAESLPEDRKMSDEIEVDEESINAAIDFNKGIIGVKYDLLFGEGTFERLYEAFPDFEALSETYELVDQAIATRIKEDEIKRAKNVGQLKKQFNQKKKRKRKMNKK